MRPGLQTEFFDSSVPRAIAHRGASAYFPENTIAAFDAAVKLGVPYIELDIHMTRDGEVVVLHDASPERTTGCGGVVEEMTFAQVSRCDAGYNFTIDGSSFPFRGAGLGVPRLADVLTAFAQTRFIVEIKGRTPDVGAAALAVIGKNGMRRRVLIASEHHEPLEVVRIAAPEMATGFSAREVAEFIVAVNSGSQSPAACGDALQVPREYKSVQLVTAQSVEAARALGIETHVWTVNQQSEMHDLLALGVAGVITDYPERLLALITNR
jgi:glycerophosphoryl diester phosphodiesterase